MVKKIALLAIDSLGGIKTILSKISRGLKLEGYRVELLKLHGPNLPYAIFSDLRNIRRLEDFDTLIYMGSIAWPSHLFLRNPRKGLFVHGFIDVELINSVKYSSFRVKAGSFILLAYRKIFNDFMKNNIDFFISHSLTSMEVNRLPKTSTVILPQFVLREEIELYEKLSRLYGQKDTGEVKILTYSSMAYSPRLLRSTEMVAIAKKLGRITKRKFTFYIIDPHGSSGFFMQSSNVRILGYLPRFKFLELLSSSDLFIERCLDEELGFSSLEAGLLSVPIAKITLPKFIERQDYNENHLIIAKSVGEFIFKLAEFINNIDYYKDLYKKGARDLIKNREWDRVKKPLIIRLR